MNAISQRTDPCRPVDSASEVIRTELHPLEDHECKLEVLRQVLSEGEQSGEPMPFSKKEFMDRIHACRDEQRRITDFAEG